MDREIFDGKRIFGAIFKIKKICNFENYKKFVIFKIMKKLKTSPLNQMVWSFFLISSRQSSRICSCCSQGWWLQFLFPLFLNLFLWKTRKPSMLYSFLRNQKQGSVVEKRQVWKEKKLEQQQKKKIFNDSSRILKKTRKPTVLDLG